LIFLAIIRRCHCEICNGEFDLKDGEEPPAECRLCGSSVWLWGREDRKARAIRQGHATKRKVLNPGAASKARQDRGLKQWRRFRTREEEEAKTLESKRQVEQN
jgi:hypothetical protein